MINWTLKTQFGHFRLPRFVLINGGSLGPSLPFSSFSLFNPPFHIFPCFLFFLLSTYGFLYSFQTCSWSMPLWSSATIVPGIHMCHLVNHVCLHDVIYTFRGSVPFFAMTLLLGGLVFTNLFGRGRLGRPSVADIYMMVYMYFFSEFHYSFEFLILMS